MPLQDWIAKPWADVITSAEEALKNQDVLTLLEVDAVVRDRFLGAMKRREPVGEFVSALLRVLACREAAETLAMADELEKLVAQWEVLTRLAEAEERVRELERNAVERHVAGRPRRQQIFDLLADRGGDVRFQEIKAELGVSDANLSGLLGELEAHAIVERERRGAETWVRLGGAGKASLGENVVELRLGAHRRAIASVLPPGYEPLPAVRFANG
jgi:DNA-binding transcriptional ArsR family regulator